jgi:hypothetical protein
MDKNDYVVQAEAFSDYANKYPDEDLITLFDRWSESKDMYGSDKVGIWRLARGSRKRQDRIISEEGEEYMRLSAVLDIILQADLCRVNRLLEGRKEVAVDVNDVMQEEKGNKIL